MNSELSGKRVLVTGACGTIGSELIRQLLEDYKVREVIGIDNNESELFFLEQKYAKYAHASFSLADVRDPFKISRKMRDMQVVFHTAAYKHVILCERSPFDAVQTNIIGVQNIINAAYENNVERVIFTSSDKAVNPTNVMGTSKLMGERLMTAANSNLRNSKTLFASTRFGNVLGSRGSVIPIFREQIRKGGPLTLTDDEMTRFIMSIKEAVQLVIDSSFLICGGEVFITKMPVINIKDLAEVMIEELAPIPCFFNMYEELMNIEETRRAVELEKYFSIIPAFRGIYREIGYEYPQIISNMVDNPYHSGNENPLTKVQLKRFLQNNNLLEDDPNENRHPEERYWP